MAENYGFTSEEMIVSDNLGYPKAFAKLCHDRGFGPYSHGPPFTYMPYALHEEEAKRARDLDQLFPIIDRKAKPTTKPKIFISLLWKQLSHLGNAGFDPEVIRVDAYGNVLYYHADSASPLAWGIDHWFPCSRGGLTVVSNLRILQRQVCKRKKNKLEFLIPWWDFQLGISVNQFLSIFASSNLEFRHRAFSFLFFEGENHELNASQIVDSHSFPQHFFGLKEEIGLAPAAIVQLRRESYDTLALRQADYNRKPRSMSPAKASSKGKGKLLKENEDPEFDINPHQAIAMARNSRKQREENARVLAEIQKLDNEVNEIKLTNDGESLTIQNLESELTKRKRKVEKCRRLAEAQCSYRTMLEKMIRDTMHQSVMYKEQVRLNQTATNALMARLEAQKEMCDAAEKELHKKYKQRDELEKEIRTEGRKRLRVDDDSTFEERDNNKPVLYLPGIRPRTYLHKELRVLLEEEQKTPEEQHKEEEKEEEMKIQANNNRGEKIERHNLSLEEESSIEHKLQKLEIKEGRGTSLPILQETETLENEERRKQRGRGNVEKWLQMLLENSQEDKDPQETDENETSGKILEVSDAVQEKNEATNVIGKGNKRHNAEACISEGNDGTTSFEGLEGEEQNKKEKKLGWSDSGQRGLRRIPSSPSMLMRKGVGRIGSSIKTIKKAVKF